MNDASATPIKIKLADIDRGGRLRPVDPDQALLIASSLAAIGLKTPIHVRPAPKKSKRPFVLVIGGHRCEAAVQLGWDEIDAIVVDVTADEARMLEVDENLFRAELTALDRAVFLAEKKRLYEKLHPETAHGGDRKSDQVIIFENLMPRFTEEVAERLGYSQPSIYRMLKRAELPEDIRSRLAGSPIADNGAELDALLKLEPSLRHRALDLVFAEKAPRIAAAASSLKGDRAAPISPDQAEFDRLIAVWRRTGQRSRDRFVAELQRQGVIEASPERKPS